MRPRIAVPRKRVVRRAELSHAEQNRAAHHARAPLASFAVHHEHVGALRPQVRMCGRAQRAERVEGRRRMVIKGELKHASVELGGIVAALVRQVEHEVAVSVSFVEETPRGAHGVAEEALRRRRAREAHGHEAWRDITQIKVELTLNEAALPSGDGAAHEHKGRTADAAAPACGHHANGILPDARGRERRLWADSIIATVFIIVIAAAVVVVAAATATVSVICAPLTWNA
mmetsp:Transcript_16804/g.43480  ORF Transcript_16804/g.43480 Transcript_16804/m.43480 type:complete len:230 (+) Transcript_16804:580-1269(+)